MVGSETRRGEGEQSALCAGAGRMGRAGPGGRISPRRRERRRPRPRTAHQLLRKRQGGAGAGRARDVTAAPESAAPRRAQPARAGARMRASPPSFSRPLAVRSAPGLLHFVLRLRRSRLAFPPPSPVCSSPNRGPWRRVTHRPAWASPRPWLGLASPLRSLRAGGGR